MTVEAAYEKIDRYCQKENIGPLLVDVQNRVDLDEIETYYNLPQNKFVYASAPKFCKRDALPSMDFLMYFLKKETGICFVRELSSLFRLMGERYLKQSLSELLSMSCLGHIVIITYQCRQILDSLAKNDLRLANRICIVEGEHTKLPQLVFTIKDLGVAPAASVVLDGINAIAQAVETGADDVIYVETKKRKSDFQLSLYVISEMTDAYNILCKKDVLTAQLKKSIGSAEDWAYALTEFNTHSYAAWEEMLSDKLGDTNKLDKIIANYQAYCRDKRWLWLYFIGLQLFGVSEDRYLSVVTEKTDNPNEFIHNIYHAILNIDSADNDYWEFYKRRKELLNYVGNPANEVADYCKFVRCMEKKAIFYLTDNTYQEQEMQFNFLDKYGSDYTKEELLDILGKVYPSLHEYLEPYDFEYAGILNQDLSNLLNKYFQEYKYQKVTNKILPEFMQVVEQQAIRRDYNLLPPRSLLVGDIDISDSQAYFTDAMGVEYLSYIVSRCQALDLTVNVLVCRSELPSITSHNKEFFDVLSSEQHPIITLDVLDKIKHHGEGDYDYSRADGKLPIHLIRELEHIDSLLGKIKTDLASGVYSKAILISDHGASRLAVIHESENLLEMQEKGKHSGRCCLKSEADVKPVNVTDAEDFWVLANYDRFKGSRKADVEVHGGATLEEVVVPIIQITERSKAIEVRIMPVDAAAGFSGMPEIFVSYRKKAAIKIFATQRLQDVSVRIDGRKYAAKPINDNFYIVESMPEIRRAKIYKLDVLSGDNTLAVGLPLRVRKESGSEKDIL